MAFLTANKLTMYYEQAGSGPDLLVINGTGSDLRVKPNIMDSPLSSHFRVTAYDQRGLGQTDKPQDGYTMAAYADDAAALLSALEIRQTLVLGISFGGMVAQELALRHGACISKLALWCTAPGGNGGASYPLHDLADLDDETRLLAMIKLNDSRIDDAFIDQHPEMVDAARGRTDLSAYADEPGWAHGRAQQLAARAAHDCWSRLDRIACPVKLMGGHYDNIAPPCVMQAMATQIPQAELTFYEGGHFFMLQDGQVFPDLVDFFKKDTL